MIVYWRVLVVITGLVKPTFGQISNRSKNAILNKLDYLKKTSLLYFLFTWLDGQLVDTPFFPQPHGSLLSTAEYSR